MIHIKQEKVMALHHIMTTETGGEPNLRDVALLDSALASAYQTFDGVELYPTIQAKAAKMGHALIANHAFVDGNKRIGMYVMMIFLEVNGVHITPTIPEVIRVGLAVASGEMDYDSLYQWICQNQADTLT